MVIATVVIIFQRFREPEIPCPPVTLGDVMSYLRGSKMLDDFEGLECLNEKTRNERVRSWGKRYEFAEMARTGGIVTWAVDDASRRPVYRGVGRSSKNENTHSICEIVANILLFRKPCLIDKVD